MSPAAALVLATARSQIADYLSTLISVYVILILVYIVSTLFFAFGGRTPYNRALNAVLEFLRQVCEPYLRFFRRFIPPLGPLDLSPMVAIIVLYVVGGVVVSLIRG
jgi:YggT family protein